MTTLVAPTEAYQDIRGKSNDGSDIVACPDCPPTQHLTADRVESHYERFHPERLVAAFPAPAGSESHPAFWLAPQEAYQDVAGENEDGMAIYRCPHCPPTRFVLSYDMEWHYEINHPDWLVPVNPATDAEWTDAHLRNAEKEPPVVRMKREHEQDRVEQMIEGGHPLLPSHKRWRRESAQAARPSQAMVQSAQAVQSAPAEIPESEAQTIGAMIGAAIREYMRGRF